MANFYSYETSTLSAYSTELGADSESMMAFKQMEILLRSNDIQVNDVSLKSLYSLIPIQLWVLLWQSPSSFFVEHINCKWLLHIVHISSFFIVWYRVGYIRRQYSTQRVQNVNFCSLYSLMAIRKAEKILIISAIIEDIHSGFRYICGDVFESLI